MFTIGCDPEIFLVSKEYGHVVPSCGLIGGDKMVARTLREDIGLNILEDNVTLEFNLDPCKTPSQLFENTYIALSTIQSEVLDPLGLHYIIKSSHRFTDDMLSHPSAKEFGCAPDFDAYRDGAPKRPINPASVGNLRCAAGHIHFGYDRDATDIPDYVLVQFLDAFCTFYHDPYWYDEHSDRRKLYGSPGTFRPKPYGFEYRTPNNYWLRGDIYGSSYISDMFNTVRAVIANESWAYNVYGSIDWKSLRTLMRTGSPRSTVGRRIREALSAHVEELREMIDEILQKDAAEAVEQAEDRHSQAFQSLFVGIG